MKSLLAILAATLLAGSITSQNVTTPETVPENLPQVDYKLCAASFVYKRHEYLGCIEVDSIGKPWCELTKPHGKTKQTRGFCKVDSIPKAMSLSAKGAAVECNAVSNTPAGKVYGCYADNNKKFLCDVGKQTVECQGLQLEKTKEPQGTNVELVGKKPNKNMESENRNGSAANTIDSNGNEVKTDGENVPKGLIAGLASAGCVGLLAVGLFVVRKRSTSRQIKARLNETATLESANPGMLAGGQVSTGKDVQFQGPYLVVSTYTPTLGDEIEILPGDMVTLLHQYDDGWAQGINETRGKVKGVFPKHCLEPWA
ncbi:hypothetical protein K493DRAFT_341313 [Basidiobolus meristosporus CBS 931.73]|uniref:SH3 domain-containing protein n=1 Tax=Basidiobolus meristosporus CBS 931.73 TaxID=1314790 RepID=A0A1Y1XRK4_9FUNG|nr:hypothetical protein K493DRAFT_341313 [Basidiobolus meristosporus CBS 931.73]|eukprot:ORX88392.1 hypothetical protein K493DRAFT_341313 [Basidiobolus meristosporus CBS 931.73]